MKRLTLAIALGSALMALSASASTTYFSDRERGWFWYEDPPPPAEKEDKKEEPVPIGGGSSAATAPLSPREQLKRQGELMEEALSQAVLDPTPENIRAFLEHSSRIQQQSQLFATRFKEVLWTEPEYDYRLERPVSTDAIIASSEEEHLAQEIRLYEIAERYGLIFFLRSDCPYCHKFGPILKRFADTYKFTVIPVSVDGRGIPDFPYPKDNIELGKKLNVSVVPALFMVDPERNKVVTVGYGYNDWTQLTAKILHAATVMESKGTVVSR